MAEGEFIKTYPLTTYPTESQELMSQVVNYFENNNIKVKRYEGSYSIISMFSGATTVKVLCTINSNYVLPGLGVAILFRAEFIDLIDSNKVNKDFPDISLRSNLVSAGGGTYRDFYFTILDSNDTYLSKKNDILNLTKMLIGRRFNRTVF
ncbi:hypothetical protein ES708_23709 [subsurface metagenome]